MPTRTDGFARGARRGRHFTQKGVALLIVMAAFALMSVLAVQFTYEANIDYAAAVNAKDEMRAHYLSQSGMNLSRLVTKVQHDVIDKYRRYIGDLQLADYLPMIMGAFGGGKEEIESLAALVGNIDTGQIKGLGLEEGEFDVEVTTDDGKINVNCAGGSAATQKQLETMLAALVLPQQYDRMFEERDGDGQFTDRVTFVSAIIDWVDRDTAMYGQSGAGEQYGYESLPQPYKARDNYLDSVDELQLVRGMDETRWRLYGPAFTIYGGCKVNVGAANDLNVIVALILQAAKDPNDPVFRDPVKLFMLAQRVAQARGFGIMFDDLAAFADFVKDPDGQLAGLLGGDGSGTQAPMVDAAGNPIMPLQGVELDPQKLSQIARAGGRRTYRVTATSRIGRVEKKIIGVFDVDTTNQNVRDPSSAKGTWVYWREE